METKSSTDAGASPLVSSGTCFATFAYEVGLSIDLDEAERRIAAMTQRATIRHKHRAPKYFDYHPSPLRVTQAGDSLTVGFYKTAAAVDAVIYDFGAVSVTYSIPLAGAFFELLAVSEDLYENASLMADSRRRVEELLAAIAPAVSKAHISDFVEAYQIFEVEAFSPACTPAELTAHYAHDLAQLLRSEREALSAEEVADALANRISFGTDDVAVIDWEAAFLLGRDLDDVRAVLEFANVELLEMRFLDGQLDDALDESYEALSRRAWRRIRTPASSRADLQRVAQLQVDGAILFEAVNNALKLLGDQYLARVYRLVSERFHLSEWDASILRKLQTLESIYQKMGDLSTGRRMEVLEWIIIILIAVSIVLPFVSGVPGH